MLSADSRDETGFADSAADSTYLAHVLPHQSVVLRVLDSSAGNDGVGDGGIGNEIQYFYLKATTFAAATPITIQRPGPVVINLSPPPQG